MRLLDRLRGPAEPPGAALYAAVVAAARRPAWYTAGGVADTIDGRFDMIALTLSVALLRIEAAGDDKASVALTERFVDDMDGNLRQIGVGDLVVGKQVGSMMGGLGGRLGAYREALRGNASLDAALVRNLYRGEAPGADALAWTAREVRALDARIAAIPLDRLLAGEFA